MPDPVAGEIGQISGNDDFRVMIPNAFEVSKFARDRFFGREQISNLYIGDFFAFVSYEIDLIVIGFSYLDIIPTIEEFKIDNVYCNRLCCLFYGYSSALNRRNNIFRWTKVTVCL